VADLVTELCRVDQIVPFPDPKIERLEMARIKGWWVMTRKGTYEVGDMCLYLPPDTVLPPALEELWTGDSKFKLTKGRIRALKFRNIVSTGMILSIKDVVDAYETLGKPAPGAVMKAKEGYDVAEDLGLMKYEPPEELPEGMSGGIRKSSPKHPDFHEYTSIKHLGNFLHEMKEGEQVYVTEKLHGTSHRMALLKFHADTWWKKILMAIPFVSAMLPKTQFCYGSRRQQLDLKKVYSGYYSSSLGNVYAYIAGKYRDCLEPGEELFGEIVGPGIQKNYSYGFTEPTFFAYDVMVDGKFLDPGDFIRWCNERQVPRVPILYLGPFSLEKIQKLATSKSAFNQPIMEGCVVKPWEDRQGMSGRVAYKCINPDYYLQPEEEQSEFH